MLSKRTLSILKVTWLPLLRIIEFLHLHDYREKYPIGFIDKKKIEQVKDYLLKRGFEINIFAWTDLGQVYSLAKPDRKIYHYHLRIFNDGEVRGHYEYNGMERPIKHVLELFLAPRSNYFKKLLKKYLIKKPIQQLSL